MTAKETLVLAILPETDERKLLAALRAIQGAEDEPLLTLDELAGRLKVHPNTIHRHAVPVALRVGGQNRYRWSEAVRHFTDGHGRTPTGTD